MKCAMHVERRASPPPASELIEALMLQSKSFCSLAKREHICDCRIRVAASAGGRIEERGYKGQSRGRANEL